MLSGLEWVVEGLARQVCRAYGIADGDVGRLWAQILAGQAGGRARAAGADTGPTRADTAWERLLALRAAFVELDLLPTLELVVAGRRRRARTAESGASSRR